MFCKEWKIISSTRIQDNSYNPVCFLRARLQQSSRLPANRLRIFAAGERANAQLRYVPSKNLSKSGPPSAHWWDDVGPTLYAGWEWSNMGFESNILT